jgi:hypothetical protein
MLGNLLIFWWPVDHSSIWRGIADHQHGLKLRLVLAYIAVAQVLMEMIGVIARRRVIRRLSTAR